MRDKRPAIAGLSSNGALSHNAIPVFYTNHDTFL